MVTILSRRYREATCCWTSRPIITAAKPRSLTPTEAASFTSGWTRGQFLTVSPGLRWQGMRTFSGSCIMRPQRNNMKPFPAPAFKLTPLHQRKTWIPCLPAILCLAAALWTASASAGDDFDYSVLARIGDAGLTAIKSPPSINDSGKVAFIGTISGGEGVFVCGDD